MDDLAALIVEERYGPPPLRDPKPDGRPRDHKPWTDQDQAAHRADLADWWVPDTQMPWGRRRGQARERRAAA